MHFTLSGGSDNDDDVLLFNILERISRSGVMDLDAYGLADLSHPLSSSIEPTKKRPTEGIASKENLKQPAHIPLLMKPMSPGDELLRSTEDQRLARGTRSRKYSCVCTRLLEVEKQSLRQRCFSSLANLIENVIEEFVPHSDAGRQSKEQIYAKASLIAATTTTLPLIK